MPKRAWLKRIASMKRKGSCKKRVKQASKGEELKRSFSGFARSREKASSLQRGAEGAKEHTAVSWLEPHLQRESSTTAINVCQEKFFSTCKRDELPPGRPKRPAVWCLGEGCWKLVEGWKRPRFLPPHQRWGLLSSELALKCITEKPCTARTFHSVLLYLRV